MTAAYYLDVVSDARSYPILDSDGKPLRSLYSDLSFKTEALVKPVVLRAGECQAKQGVWAKLVSVFSLQRVAAMTCSAACFGHYSVADIGECTSLPCSGPYAFYYQDSTIAPYDSGYEISGSACNGCRCYEAACTNP